MFVTFEGTDRAGKSTQAKLLARSLGEETVLIREPGGTDLAERLRVLLKDPDLEADPRAELLLFAAARADLVARVIAPALAEGRHVVCDRFSDSTVAYQGAGRGLGVDLANRVNELATGGIEPDVTILLGFGDGSDRLGHAGLAGDDRFENEGDGFQRVVADEYRRLAERFPDRIRKVEASGTPKQVHARVLAALADAGFPVSGVGEVGA